MYGCVDAYTWHSYRCVALLSRIVYTCTCVHAPTEQCAHAYTNTIDTCHDAYIIQTQWTPYMWSVWRQLAQHSWPALTLSPSIFIWWLMQNTTRSSREEKRVGVSPSPAAKSREYWPPLWNINTWYTLPLDLQQETPTQWWLHLYTVL